MKTLDFSAWIDRAKQMQDGGDLDEVITCYRNALGMNPESIDANIGLGNSLMCMRRYADAIQPYLAVLHLEPTNIVANHNLGEAYHNMGRLPEAEASYKTARDLCPDMPEPHINLGRVFMKQGRLMQAVESFEMALQVDPHSAIAHHNLGLCVYDDECLEDAAREFKTAIDIDPANVLACCFYGVINSQMGREQIARQCYRRAATMSPFTECLIESYLYTLQHDAKPRYFSTSSEILRFGVAAAANEGLFLEFGVYNGASISLIAGCIDKAIHGFDSFEGIPDEWHVGSASAVAVEAAGTYSTDGKLPMVPDNVQLHVGRFADSLPGFLDEHHQPVSFMNVDCDLYSSTHTVFTNFEDRIIPGTIIVFDEYLCYPEWRQGEYKAFQEFVADLGVSYDYLAFSFFTGQAVVRIRSAQGEQLQREWKG